MATDPKRANLTTSDTSSQKDKRTGFQPRNLFEAFFGRKTEVVEGKDSPGENKTTDAELRSLTDDFFGRQTTVVSSEKSSKKSEVGLNDVANVLFSTKVKVTENREVEEQAREYAVVLHPSLGKTAGEVGGAGAILRFTEGIYKKYYNKDFYFDERTQIKDVYDLLVAFDGKVTTVKRGKYEVEDEEEKKEVDSVALNSEDLSILLEEYETYLEEHGEDEEEIRKYLERFVPDNKKNQIGKLVASWKMQIAETRKMKLGGAGVSDEKSSQELAKMEVDEIVKKANLLVVDGDEKLDFAQTRDLFFLVLKTSRGELPTEDHIKSAVSQYDHTTAGKKIGLLDNKTLELVKDSCEKVIARNAVLVSAEKILKSAEVEVNAKTLRAVASAMVVPEEPIVTGQFLEKVIKEGTNRAIAEKTVTAGAQKFLEENPRLVFIARSDAVSRVVDGAAKKMVFGTVVANIADPVERVKTQKAIMALARMTKSIHTDEVARLWQMEGRDKGLSTLRAEEGDTKTDFAVGYISAMAGYARKLNNKPALAEYQKNEDQVAKYGLSMDGLSRYGHQAKRVLDFARNPRNTKFLAELKKRTLTSETAGSVLQKLQIEKIEKILNIDKVIINKAITYLAKTETVKGLEKAFGALIGKIGLSELSGAAVSKLAGGEIGALAGTLTGIPVVGQIVGWIVGDLIGKSIEKSFSGVSRAVKQGDYLAAAGQIAMVPVSLVGNFFLELGKLIVKLTVGIFVVVTVVTIITIYVWSVALSNLYSTFVPPRQLNSFELNPGLAFYDAFNGGAVPEECPWGYPVNGTLTQGPGGSYSHNNANAIDIGGIFQGTIVKATHAGEVVFSGWDNSGYGNLVILKGTCTFPTTGERVAFRTYYGHNMDGGLPLAVGSKVKRGDKIALAGTTGNSTGVHVHYELRDLSNILNFLPRDAITALRMLGCLVGGPFVCAILQ